MRSILPYLWALCAIVNSGQTAEPTRWGSDDGLSTLESSPQARGNADRARPPRVYRNRVDPHWFADNSKFWYRNDLQDGAKEFVLVDAEAGTREPAFDHVAIASAIAEDGRLPIDELRFSEDGRHITLIGPDRRWRLNRETGALTESQPEEREISGLPMATEPRPSRRNGPQTQITFDNRTPNTVELFWVDSQGQRQSYGNLASGERHEQNTYGGHVWLVTGEDGEIIGVFEATDDPDIAIIDPSRQTERPRTGPRNGGFRRGNSRNNESPDGQWTAFIQDNNLFIRSNANETETIQLTEDGREGSAYGRVSWSPNSETLVAFRIEPGDRKEVHLIESSPDGGGRARLQSRVYDLPGDQLTTYEIHLFDVKTRERITPEVDPFTHGWQSPQLRWLHDGQRVAYTQVDRGHQRFRVIEVDTDTGAVRNIIDEQSDTFIWTAHTENLGLDYVNWLETTNEMIYVSERDGWRHLYLVDVDTGAIKNQITKGDWVTFGIERIDEEKRQIWFRAGGVNPDQDPYFEHFYRVNFDGTGFVALTEGNGTHSIEFSPDGRYLIDTYSRVDQAPINELRRVSDGQLVCQLEVADIQELTASSWNPPEVFVAKGRDGQTDIWGNIYRPQDFDATKKYPIIEDIYAGPQSSYTPKSFSSRNRYRELNDMGFIVVKMDGMGTANRSKAFHDVCWKNLKDGGFEDRILWTQAAAAQYPYMDLDRVGVYGTSAGGQNAAAAVLFHPEFYKVAVAACGCHDNRMDKASWNEQWMGYLPSDRIWSDEPDNWYAASSNIDNAWRLQGNLLLIVGEMDSNVPPESTLRFADALIKADKVFDLLVIPGAGHGMGGAYGAARMRDYFSRHLLGQEPQNPNARRSATAPRSE